VTAAERGSACKRSTASRHWQPVTDALRRANQRRSRSVIFRSFLPGDGSPNPCARELTRLRGIWRSGVPVLCTTALPWRRRTRGSPAKAPRTASGTSACVTCGKVSRPRPAPGPGQRPRWPARSLADPDIYRTDLGACLGHAYPPPRTCSPVHSASTPRTTAAGTVSSPSLASTHGGAP